MWPEVTLAITAVISSWDAEIFLTVRIHSPNKDLLQFVHLYYKVYDGLRISAPTSGRSPAE
ncbi:MAG: hypothetical protein WCK53_06110 [Methanomicrobiales archaeon]